MQKDVATQQHSRAASPQYASYPAEVEGAAPTPSPRSSLPFIRSLTPTFKRTSPAPELPNSRFIPEAERGWKKRTLKSDDTAGAHSSPSDILPNGSEIRRLSVPQPSHLSEVVSSSAQVDSAADSATRGYHWRPSADGQSREWVNFSHRNPTAKQAFYDTHFGSSSFIRSFQQATLGWKERKPRQTPSASPNRSPPRTPSPPHAHDAHEEDLENEELAREANEAKQESASRWQELMQSWHALPSLSELPLPLPLRTKSKQSSTRPPLMPETIPTVTFPFNAPDYIQNLSPSNVVMLGGYRGSVLRDSKTNHRMWIPIKVGVGIRQPSLEIGLTAEAEENSTDLVKPSGMVLKVARLADMGQRLQQRCSSQPGVQVHSFGYDWRLSLARSSSQLEKFLQHLYEQSSSDPDKRQGAKVIAHSMGGLIALHALSCTDNPRIFESLVFVSTPFLGTANILGPLRYGDAALYNRKICSPRATFSFRSSFYLLPPDGQCFEDQDGVARNVDFLNPDSWYDLGFSPCLDREARPRVAATGAPVRSAYSATAKTDDGVASAGLGIAKPPVDAMQMGPHSSTTLAQTAGETVASTVAEVSDNLDLSDDLQVENQAELDPDSKSGHSLDEQRVAWAYLERTLAEVRRFRKDIEDGFEDDRFDKGAYPPIAILASGTTPTVRGALVTNADGSSTTDGWKKDVRDGDYSRMLFAPGDGVVLHRSAITLPGRWAKVLVKPEETFLPATTTGKKAIPASSIPPIVESSHRHVTLLSDITAVGMCLEACRRARLARMKESMEAA